MKNTRGQGLVEYLILVCLVAVSTIAVVSVLGTNIREHYAQISNSLRHDSAKIKLTKPAKSTYQRRGMDNYSEGAETDGGGE